MSVSTLTKNSTNVRYAMAFAWHRARLSLASRIAPHRAAEAAARLFATPPRRAMTPREREFLDAASPCPVATRHGLVAAWRLGRADRPAVLLSHGWGARGAHLRAFAIPLLEAGYQAVLFDHPGHGESEGAESSLVHFVDALDAVAARVESAGAPLAGVIGHSLGAAAAGAWLNHNARPLRAVLLAPPTSIHRHSTHFARRLGLTERVRSAMQERFERRLGRRWEEFELPHAVARVRAAALVLHDADDRDVPLASGLALARAWPEASIVVTRGLGHRAIVRDPTVARDAVEFMAGRMVFPPAPRAGETAAFGAPAPLL